MVASARRRARRLDANRGGAGRGHIVSPRAQLPFMLSYYDRWGPTANQRDSDGVLRQTDSTPASRRRPVDLDEVDF